MTPILISMRDAAHLTRMPLRTFYRWFARNGVHAYPPAPGRNGRRVDWVQVDDILNPESKNQACRPLTNG